MRPSRLPGAALNGEGWRQAAELGLALALSAVIGLEREIRQKSAGLRTHTLVGLPILAAMTTAIYFLVALVFPLAVRRLPRSATAISALRVRYPDGRGILRDVLREATDRGFAINDVSTEAVGYQGSSSGQSTPS